MSGVGKVGKQMMGRVTVVHPRSLTKGQRKKKMWLSSSVYESIVGSKNENPCGCRLTLRSALA